MSSHAGHDLLRDQIILAVSQSGFGRCWNNEVGLFRLFDRPDQVVRIGVNGVADILGILQGGFFLAIEVKTGKGKLRESQINFRAMVQKFNGCFIEARSIDQVISEIREFLHARGH